MRDMERMKVLVHRRDTKYLSLNDENVLLGTGRSHMSEPPASGQIAAKERVQLIAVRMEGGHWTVCSV